MGAWARWRRRREQRAADRYAAQVREWYAFLIASKRARTSSRAEPRWPGEIL